MTYDDEMLQEINASVDLLEYVSKSIEMEKRGRDYFGHCPLHVDNTPSFSITPSKNSYYCFSCGRSGGIIGYLMDYEHLKFDDAVDKYKPGKQVFRLQSVSGLNNNSTAIETVAINVPNLMNKNRPDLTEVHTSACCKLDLPRDVTRNYPLKFIPAGTRFIMSFNSGDITKPVIVGREFE